MSISLILIILGCGLGIFAGIALTKGPSEKSEKHNKDKKER